MGSRFNFTLVRKADPRVNVSRNSKPNADAVRITKKNFNISKNLIKRFGPDKHGVTVRIEKDPTKMALRITPVANGNTKETYRLVWNQHHTVLFTSRPQPLFDMPNGSYFEDLKEPGVYVLES